MYLKEKVKEDTNEKNRPNTLKTLIISQEDYLYWESIYK